jgi:Lysylphosphatidylglycerol synthase TM region
MLSRLTGNPIIRIVLLAGALGFCGLGLASDWPQVHAVLSQLHWYSVAGSFLAACAGSWCLFLAWRAVAADLGCYLTVPATVRIVSIAQIAKYLPGVIWAFAAYTELGKDYRIPRRLSAATAVIALGVAVGTGLFIGMATLPAASAGAVRHYWWMLALAPLIAACLLPPVLRRLLDRAFALARRDPLDRPLTSRGLLRAVAWSALAWVFWGLHAWLLIASLPAETIRANGTAGTFVLALGAYALAWSAGILLVIFPGGIGPRELALVVALSPIMPRGSALVIALLSRVVMTISDVAWASCGVALARLTRRARIPAATVRFSGGKHRKPRSGRLAPQSPDELPQAAVDRPRARVVVAPAVVAVPQAAAAVPPAGYPDRERQAI